MQKDLRAGEVDIVDFATTNVAVLTHRGDPARLDDSIQVFMQWRKENSVPPRISATYNILYESPNQVDASEFRFDLCAAIDREIPENRFGVVRKTIPGGRCAVMRHLGSDRKLEASVSYLYRTWLPESQVELRDCPMFLHRVLFFPDVPEREAITDVYLPIT